MKERAGGRGIEGGGERERERKREKERHEDPSSDGARLLY